MLARTYPASLLRGAPAHFDYRPGQLARAVRFMRSNEAVDFATPYDHPDYYRMKLHEGEYAVKYDVGLHWRTTASTCLTFLARKRALQETRDAFMSYARGNSDLGMWMAITKRNLYSRNAGYAWKYCWKHLLFGRKKNLWAPIPSIATHMERDNLAPTMESIDFARIDECLS